MRKQRYKCPRLPHIRGNIFTNNWYISQNDAFVAAMLAHPDERPEDMKLKGNSDERRTRAREALASNPLCS